MRHGLVGRKWSAKISARIQLFYNCNNKALHYNCNTTILLRRELRTLSYLVFWNFAKYSRNVFETPSNDYIWLAECGKLIHLTSKEAENKRYVKGCILKNIWKLYETINELISCNIPHFFYWKSTQRETGLSKGTPRALGHSGTLNILGNSNTQRALGYAGTQALGHLDIRGTLFNRL